MSEPKYIYADDAVKQIEKLTYEDGRSYAVFGANWIIDFLEAFPAADVEPVRHGRWIWDDEGFHCSECWIHAYGDTCEVLSGQYHYCPYCGARMEYPDESEVQT